MKPKLATITALVIGMLIAITGMFPAPRNAAISFFRGESRLLDLVDWRRWGRGATEPESVEQSTNIGGERGAAIGADGLLGGGHQPLVADHRAENLLGRSIAMLERCRSIVAMTRQTVDLYGKHLVGSGEYLEQRDGPTLKFRLELKVQVGSDPRTLLHVRDSRYFWRCESYQGKGTAERIDLARAAQARDGRVDLGPTAKIGDWPGLGGLPGLLRDLRDWFQFTAVEERKLSDQTPVLRISGVWKPDRLATLMPERRPASKSSGSVGLQRLPEHLPDSVVLFLGREDLFPFRIEYRRRVPRSPLGQGAEEDSAVVTMDLFDVSLNTPLDDLRFKFAPGNLEYSDQTDRFLERLGLKKKP